MAAAPRMTRSGVSSSGDGYVPEDFPYAEDDDDDFDVTSYAD